MYDLWNLEISNLFQKYHWSNNKDANSQYALSYPGADFIQDYINVHIALGLGLRIGPNVILTPLDAVKNHEFWILGPKVDTSFALALYAVHLTFIHELHVLCWSAGMTWVPFMFLSCWRREFLIRVSQW